MNKAITAVAVSFLLVVWCAASSFGDDDPARMKYFKTENAYKSSVFPAPELLIGHYNAFNQKKAYEILGKTKNLEKDNAWYVYFLVKQVEKDRRGTREVFSIQSQKVVMLDSEIWIFDDMQESIIKKSYE